MAGKDKPKTGGRKKGTANKVTALLRDMIAESLANVGGVRYLEGLARSEPVAYAALLRAMLPLQLQQAANDAIVPLLVTHEHVTRALPEPVIEGQVLPFVNKTAAG